MNEYKKRNYQGGNVVWLVVLVAVVVFGFLLFKGWDKVVNDEIDKTTTITGNFSCLPLKTGVVDATDCTLGVKSRDGSFYALDISRIQDANTDLEADDTIAVTGFLQLIADVKSSEWDAYNVAGVIKVNTLLRTR